MRKSPPKGAKNLNGILTKENFLKRSVIRISTRYPWSEETWDYMTSDDASCFSENKMFYSVKK